jgi:hypothetical protein
MNTAEVFPAFDDYFPDLNQLILRLVEDYQAGKIKSWDELEKEIKAYFTPQRMGQMESDVPGWKNMASYSDGITLVHVMCVFLGLFMLSEFQRLTAWQKQLAKWIVLFHDVAKIHIRGKRDTTHAFRSAVLAAGQLPHFGFSVTSEYGDLISSWKKFTSEATKVSTDFPESIQDNEKLPEILSSLEKMFGKDTPGALIVKCVLLHMSISVVTEWPQAAALAEEEIKRYIEVPVVPLLKVMMLADNEGWVMFSSERQQQRDETLGVFQRIETIVAR